MNMLERQLPLRTPESTTKDDKIRKSGIITVEDVSERYLKKDDAIKMADFEDVYSAEEIKKDTERVEYIKKSKGFEKPTAESVILENMFSDLVEKYKWFGEGVKVVQLSEFDDKIASGAHCDAVLEIPVAADRVIRIGIDLTTAVNYDTLSKKRTKCVEGVQSGKLFSVKYFQSKIDGTKGQISDLPVFFAGLDKNTLKNLCEAVAKQENTGNDSMEKHEGQFIFLDEMLSQSNRYIAIAKVKHGAESNTTIWMEYYKQLLEWIRDNKKAPRPNNFGQRGGQDEVYRYITKFV